jgi:hypothetical protein
LTGRTPGAAEGTGRPAYSQLRYNEDWSFLRDESRRTDYLDRLKYISLGREGWHVTVGGEMRLYYENFRNETWGSDPADASGFWLQRFMLHADWRLGARVRVFSQLKSGEIEDRVGGPRPPDKDDLDVRLTALAMGLRNATVRRLAVPDLTTTVLTLTLTGLAADSSLAGGANPRIERRIASVLLMFAGAAIGTLLLHLGLSLSFFLSGACVLAVTTVYIAVLPPTPSGGKAGPIKEG